MSAKYYVFARGRWCEVDAATGRVAGWRRRARFLFASRGRLELARTAAVLRGLRALAEGNPKTVRDGAPLSQRRKKSRCKRRALSKRHCCSACSGHRLCCAPNYISNGCNNYKVSKSPEVFKMADAGVQVTASLGLPSSQDTNMVHPIPASLEARKSPTKQSAQERVVSPKKIREDYLKPRPKRRKISSDEQVRVARKSWKHLLDDGITLSQPTENNTKCKELIIDENDVDLYRSYLIAHDAAFDLYRFDTDEAYKLRVFFRINPLVSIERCAQMERMMRASQSSQAMSLKDFATKLGLRSISDHESESQKRLRRYKMRKRNGRETTIIEESTSDGEAPRTKQQKTITNNTKKKPNPDETISICSESESEERNKTRNKKDKQEDSDEVNKKSRKPRHRIKKKTKNTTSESSSDEEDNQNSKYSDKDEAIRENNRIRVKKNQKRYESSSDYDSSTDSSNESDAKNNKSKTKHKTTKASEKTKHNLSTVKNNKKAKQNDLSETETTDNRTRTRNVSKNQDNVHSKKKLARNYSSGEESANNRTRARNLAKKTQDNSSDDSDSDSTNTNKPVNRKTVPTKRLISSEKNKSRSNKNNDSSQASSSQDDETNRNKNRKIDNIKAKTLNTENDTSSSSEEDTDKENNDRSQTLRPRPNKNMSHLPKTMDKKAIELSSSDDSDFVKLPKSKKVMKPVKQFPLLFVNKTNPPRVLKKRSDYSNLEDHAIVSFISSGPRARQVNGNRVWRELQGQFHALTGIARTWHSLRNRYLRYILPTLGRLALPPQHVARLRAAAAAGEIKSKSKPGRRASIFAHPPVRSAFAAKRPPAQAQSESDAEGPARKGENPPEAPKLRILRSSGAHDAPTNTLHKSPNKSSNKLRDKSPKKPDKVPAKTNTPLSKRRDKNRELSTTPTYEQVTRQFASRFRSTPTVDSDASGRIRDKSENNKPQTKDKSQNESRDKKVNQNQREMRHFSSNSTPSLSKSTKTDPRERDKETSDKSPKQRESRSRNRREKSREESPVERESRSRNKSQNHDKSKTRDLLQNRERSRDDSPKQFELRNGNKSKNRDKSADVFETQDISRTRNKSPKEKTSKSNKSQTREKSHTRDDSETRDKSSYTRDRSRTRNKSQNLKRDDSKTRASRSRNKSPNDTKLRSNRDKSQPSDRSKKTDDSNDIFESRTLKKSPANNKSETKLKSRTRERSFALDKSEMDRKSHTRDDYATRDKSETRDKKRTRDDKTQKDKSPSKTSRTRDKSQANDKPQSQTGPTTRDKSHTRTRKLFNPNAVLR